MDIHVFDNNLNFVGVIDEYSSLIWTDRYNKCGDFELVTIPNTQTLDLLVPDYYIAINDSRFKSNRMMIIEDLEIQTDSESEPKLTVTGRSLESILDRRIVWGEKALNGTLQNGVKQLLNDSIISPSDSKRRISNFIFEENPSSVLATININTTFKGTSILEAITELCSTCRVGFGVTLNELNQFVFRLYLGVDRSYEQVNNPYVVFSNDFDNLSNTKYIEKSSTYKNCTFVMGSDNYNATVAGEETGLDRREVFTDASGSSKDVNVLASKGEENLAKCTYTVSFDGEADPSAMYQYLRDYNIGDIVEIVNEYGIEGQVRISEYIQSDDSSGFTAYPSFTRLEDELENNK